MQDYRYMKMYTVPGTNRILILRESIPTEIFIIVSPFDAKKTEEENVRAIHDLYPHAPGKQTSSNLIYGDAEGESFGRRLNPTSTTRLLGNTANRPSGWTNHYEDSNGPFEEPD